MVLNENVPLIFSALPSIYIGYQTPSVPPAAVTIQQCLMSLLYDPGSKAGFARIAWALCDLNPR